MRENLLTRILKMFTGSVGPVQVFFIGPKQFLRIFTELGPAVHC